MCVSGETRIQTRGGCPKITDVLETVVNVWDGKAWVPTSPFESRRNKHLYRVTLSDGSYLDCTSDHVWFVKSRHVGCFTKFRHVKTADLKAGDQLKTFSMSKPCDDGVENLKVDVFSDNVYHLNKASMTFFLLDQEFKEHTEEVARGLQLLFRRVRLDNRMVHEELHGPWRIRVGDGSQHVLNVMRLDGLHTVYETECGSCVFNNCLTKS